jgi:hypothetical protein
VFARSRGAWARLLAMRPSTLLGPLEREVDRAEQWLSEDHPELPGRVVREAALVAGLPVVESTEWTAPALPMLEPDKEGLAYCRNIRAGVQTLQVIGLDR